MLVLPFTSHTRPCIFRHCEACDENHLNPPKMYRYLNITQMDPLSSTSIWFTSLRRKFLIASGTAVKYDYIRDSIFFPSETCTIFHIVAEYKIYYRERSFSQTHSPLASIRFYNVSNSLLDNVAFKCIMRAIWKPVAFKEFLWRSLHTDVVCDIKSK